VRRLAFVALEIVFTCALAGCFRIGFDHPNAEFDAQVKKAESLSIDNARLTSLNSRLQPDALTKALKAKAHIEFNDSANADVEMKNACDRLPFNLCNKYWQELDVGSLRRQGFNGAPGYRTYIFMCLGIVELFVFFGGIAALAYFLLWLWNRPDTAEVKKYKNLFAMAKKANDDLDIRRNNLGAEDQATIRHNKLSVEHSIAEKESQDKQTTSATKNFALISHRFAEEESAMNIRFIKIAKKVAALEAQEKLFGG